MFIQSLYFLLDNFKFKYTNAAFMFLDFDNGRL